QPKSFREEGCAFVDKSFADAFHLSFISGGNGLANPNSMIITESLAKKIFGPDQAEGKVLRLHNQFGDLSCTITGVVADLPVQSDIHFSCLLPIQILDDKIYTADADWAHTDSWSNNSYTTWIELDEQANPASVANVATRAWQQQDPIYKAAEGVISLQPLPELHLGSGLRDDNPTYGSRAMTYLIFGLGMLVLCIAWINYINFSTAYALSQARNIGIQKVIGSSRWQIVLRYMTESLLLNLGGIVLALLLVYSVQEWYNYLSGKPLGLHYIRSVTSWITGAGIMIAGMLLCG
ncbi:MAG: ABC transporter permease, partial [Bacteroidetes bacterium]|nr:ABC transporter permease [Bacteroidota bacterium]